MPSRLIVYGSLSNKRKLFNFLYHGLSDGLIRLLIIPHHGILTYSYIRSMVAIHHIFHIVSQCKGKYNQENNTAQHKGYG